MKTLILGALFCVSLIGIEAHQVSRYQATAAFRALSSDVNAVAADAYYDTTSTQAILESAKRFHTELVAEGVVYRAEQFDCEDFSAAFVGHFKKESAGTTTKQNPLLAVVYYKTDAGSGHAVVAYGVRSTTTPHLRYKFLEVTLSMGRGPCVFKLSASEMRSIRVALF
jgi:hypothetical protein